MSFLNNLFSTKPAAPAAPPAAPGGAANPQGNQNPQNQGQSGQPGSAQPGQNVTKSNEPADPIASLNKLWDNPSQQDANDPPSFSLDPAVLDKVAGSMDFLKGLDPDIAQKASTGDSQALLQLMSHGFQNVYKQALTHGGALTGSFVDARESHVTSKRIPSMIKDHLTENALATSSANLPPFVQKMQQDLAKRVRQHFPEATPQQVQELVNQQINSTYQAMQEADPAYQARKKSSDTEAQGMDWDSYLNDSNPN